MAKRRLPLLIVDALLVIVLIKGLLLFRDPGVARLPLTVGILFNLCLLWGSITVLRRQKSNQQLSRAEQAATGNWQRVALRQLLIGSSFLVAALTVNVALFISHIYSMRAFAFVTLGAATLTFVFLTFRFSQLKRSQG